MHFQLAIFALFGLFTLALCNYPPCSDVGTTTGKLNAVTVEGCDPTRVCSLVKGTTKRIDVDFTPSADSQLLESHISATLAGIQVPFPGFKTDACNPELGIQCPLKANSQYKYSNSFKVLEAYPSLKTQVKFQFKDSDANTIVCFLINVTITD